MSSEFQFENNVSTTLAESISATATVINVASGAGADFPSLASGEVFAITLVDAATGLTNEICYCTARSSDQLTVVRGREGTTATAFSAGDTVAMFLTAGILGLYPQAGLFPAFDYSFASNIGGYSKNAIVSDSSTAGLFWVSTANNNLTTPGASGASWYPLVSLESGKMAQGGWTEQYYTLAANGSRTIELSFTAPYPGYVHVEASANFAAQNGNSTLLSTAVNGTELSADNVNSTTCMSNGACTSVSAGSVAVSSYLGTSSTSPPNVGHTLRYLFVPS